MDTTDILNASHYYNWPTSSLVNSANGNSNVLFEDPNTGRKIYKHTTGLRDGVKGSEQTNLYLLYNAVKRQENMIKQILATVDVLTKKVAKLEQTSPKPGEIDEIKTRLQELTEAITTV